MAGFSNNFHQGFDNFVVFIPAQGVEGVFAVAFDIDDRFAFEDPEMVGSDSLFDLELAVNVGDGHLAIVEEQVDHGDPNGVGDCT